MSNFIGVDISGITTITERLKKLPKEARDLGVETANEYIVHAMQVQPPKPTKPFVWSSDKQRAYVMAIFKGRDSAYTAFTGKGYAGGRTQELRKGWKTVGKGYSQIVVNETGYAQFVQGDNQIIGHKTNNWQTITMVLKNKSKEILKKFEGGVKSAIKKLKLN